MEVVLLVAAAASLGAAALALLSPEGPAPRVRGRLPRAVAARVLGGLRRLGRTRLVEAVLGTRLGRGLADELAGRWPKALPVPDVRMAAAALVSLCGAAVAAVALAFGSASAGLVFAAALVAAVVARDAARRQREGREVLAAMPGIYRTLSVAMGSGQTLAQAVAYVGSHGEGPAAAVFARMSLRLRCGTSTEDAVACLSRELAAPGVDLLATALVIAHQTGSPLRELLLRSARLVERQGEFERLLAVKTAQVRLSVRIVCLLPVVMVGLLALISPDFQQGLLTPSGAGCVLVALALDGVALALIRRLVRGVL